tara:strand:- start:90 stop:293 length:204 start_codon:yes stop_codon:yes gene_type:complete
MRVIAPLVNLLQGATSDPFITVSGPFPFEIFNSFRSFKRLLPTYECVLWGEADRFHTAGQNETGQNN